MGEVEKGLVERLLHVLRHDAGRVKRPLQRASRPPLTSSWTTLLRVDEVLMMLGCRRCGAPFFVCRRDYRGQAYCGDTCRAAARVISARAARRRHERSDAGRLDHRDRQRAYRMRLRARVTDQAPLAVPSPRTLSPLRSTPAPRAPPCAPPEMRSLRSRVGLGAAGAAAPNPAAPKSSRSRPRATGPRTLTARAEPNAHRADRPGAGCTGDGQSGRLLHRHRGHHSSAMWHAPPAPGRTVPGIDYPRGPMRFARSPAPAVAALLLGALGCPARPPPLPPLPPRSEVRRAGVVEIAAGAMHTCALRAGGSVDCWGTNQHGQLGVERLALAWAPARVPGVDDAVQIAAGWGLTCRRRREGAVRCWGSVREGRRHAPADVAGIAGAIDLAVGLDRVCAVLRDGGVAQAARRRRARRVSRGPRARSRSPPGPTTSARCWPTAPCAAGAATTSVSSVTGRSDRRAGPRAWSGSTTSCASPPRGAGAVPSARAARSPAGATSGRTTETEPWTPPMVSGLVAPPAARARGGVYADGTVECVRRNGAMPERRNVAGISDAVQVVAGLAHFCALGREGRVRCWGRGSEGQLGDPSAVSAAPRRVPGLDDARDLAAGTTSPARRGPGGGGPAGGITRSGAARARRRGPYRG